MARERIFIGGQNGYVIGAVANLETGEGRPFELPKYESAQKNDAQVERESLLSVVVKTLSETDLENAEEPVELYVFNSLYDSITKQTYKYWLMNGGVKSNGEMVDEIELTLWQAFSDIMQGYGERVVIRDLYRANFRDKETGEITATFDLENVEFNQVYFDWINENVTAKAPKRKKYVNSTNVSKPLAKAKMPSLGVAQ